MELIRLFLGFSSNNGNDKFNYLYHFSRIAYLLIKANGFIFDILKENTIYTAIAKPLLSPLSIQKQLKSLEEITPEILFIDKKAIAAANIILLSLCISEFVKELNFPMKKGKGDRIYEAIFDLLFRGKKIKDNFELKNSIKSLDRYF